MYITQHILRLCRKEYKNIRKYKHTPAGKTVHSNKTKSNVTTAFEHLLHEKQNKIIFNSYIEQDKIKLGHFRYYLQTIKAAKKKDEEVFKEKSLPPLPVALKYYVDQDKLLRTEEIGENTQVTEQNQYQLPFAKITSITIDNDESEPQSILKSNHWMTAYEHFNDSILEQEGESVDTGWGVHYGKPDAQVPISKVPCGGCGALLQCSEPAIPGYLPSEILKGRNDTELQTIECQRCHFLKEYNIALDVSVEPDEYAKLLQVIKHVKSLVILMVDLLDFPCSIWPGIVDIIGTNRPLIVVGNKVDLLPGDSEGYLKRVEGSLMLEIKKTKLADANIKHVSLISAKTGYGVEDLVSNMFKVWLGKGDVFLVGCTNVGKSSLFNALLQSDYCKVQAVDIVRRATVSRWPGTTLNLLKFPINRPSGWKIYQRTQRLKVDKKKEKMEQEIRAYQLENKIIPEAPALIGHIGRSFANPKDFQDPYTKSAEGLMTLNEKDEVFAQSNWFYDTPGVILQDHILSLLTTEELLSVIPKEIIKPQTYYLKKGTTMLIGGLARIDFDDCTEPCRFSIFCSKDLPITITKTEDADDVYEAFLGTELLGAPMGSSARLEAWPGLQRHSQRLAFVGEGPKQCCGDVVLSSVGWVSITAKKNSTCQIYAWTPQGRGVHVRYPSTLPYSVNLKGARLRDTPAYMTGKIYTRQ